MLAPRAKLCWVLLCGFQRVRSSRFLEFRLAEMVATTKPPSEDASVGASPVPASTVKRAETTARDRRSLRTTAVPPRALKDSRPKQEYLPTWLSRLPAFQDNSSEARQKNVPTATASPGTSRSSSPVAVPATKLERSPYLTKCGSQQKRTPEAMLPTPTRLPPPSPSDYMLVAMAESEQRVAQNLPVLLPPDEPPDDSCCAGKPPAIPHVHTTRMSPLLRHDLNGAACRQ